ncbi:MAG: hypothetical protein L3J56_06675 [Bacteroidales bacterium]|nr:hypothetical protein [Bacteroidales bacterium]
MITSILENIRSITDPVSISKLHRLHTHTLIQADSNILVIVNNKTKHRIIITPPENAKNVS